VLGHLKPQFHTERKAYVVLLVYWIKNANPFLTLSNLPLTLPG